ncbi:MAG TPA: cation:proton antiporter [Ignavibacteriaceae bacterium]|nr:cation:proton antiporter [Ignavibacteriaceae bacterium]
MSVPGEIIQAAIDSDILKLLIQISVLLITARIFGELSQKLGQPAVLGEILAGIVLGPSLLGNLLPFIHGWIIPATETQINLLEVITLIGAMFLLLITGLETDLALIKHHSKKAAATAFGGLLIPFVAGYIFSLYIPDELLIDPSQRVVFGLFLATAMSLSAIPVIAKVLIDLKLIRRDIGQITIAAGMIDDTAAWIVLSIVLGLIGGEAVTTGTIAYSFGKVILFVGLSFFIGKAIAKYLVSFTLNKISSRDKILTLIVVFTFVLGAIAQAIQLEAVLGAFIAGIIFAQMPSIPKESIEKVESTAFGIFAPIFFAGAGLKVNLLDLFRTDLIVIGAALITVAVLSKIIGAYLGSRLLTKTDHWTALSFGAGLNARGAIQIIVATIGLSFGILSQEIYSLIIITAVVTSLMAPVMLRWTLSHVKPEAQEIKRLQQEELLKDNFLVRVHRVLLPVRKRDIGNASLSKMIEARILERIGRKTDLDVTLLTISAEKEKAESQQFLNTLAGFFTKFPVSKKIAESKNTLESILDEVKKDYDLLIVGATERQKNSDMLFNPIVDNLVRLSPCPSIVVQSSNVAEDWRPSRILVPTNGSLASKRAAEIAFGIAYHDHDQVHILNVVESKDSFASLDIEGRSKERRLTFAHQIVEELKKLGESLNVNTFTEVEIGEEPDKVILKMSKEKNFDLIILGTDIRPGTDKLYLGPRVERILNNCSCPVLVVNGA